MPRPEPTAADTPLRCRLGLHKWQVWWPNIAPFGAGGPFMVEDECDLCGKTKLRRNNR